MVIVGSGFSSEGKQQRATRNFVDSLPDFRHVVSPYDTVGENVLHTMERNVTCGCNGRFKKKVLAACNAMARNARCGCNGRL